jgi:hypothetical protein
MLVFLFLCFDRKACSWGAWWRKAVPACQRWSLAVFFIFHIFWRPNLRFSTVSCLTRAFQLCSPTSSGRGSACYGGVKVRCSARGEVFFTWDRTWMITLFSFRLWLVAIGGCWWKPIVGLFRGGVCVNGGGFFRRAISVWVSCLFVCLSVDMLPCGY